MGLRVWGLLCLSFGLLLSNSGPLRSQSIEQGPIEAYLAKAQDQMRTGFESGGTTAALTALETLLKPFAQGGDLPFTHQDFRALALKIGGGKPVELQVGRTSANIAEANRRLKRIGIDYLVLVQSSQARLVELVREFYQAEQDDYERLREIFRLSHAQDPMADERSVYYLPMLPDEVEKANEVLKRRRYTQVFRADPKVKKVEDVALFPFMKQPFGDQQRAFDRWVNTRTFLNITLPFALGPVVSVLGGNFQFGAVASAGMSSALEYQFVKPVSVFGRQILGNAFWTQKIAQHGQKLIVGLNVLYPALCTLAGAAAAALAGEAYAFNAGDMIVHPFFSLVTFGLLSFGYAQTQAAKQLEQGYTDRFHQFRFESVSQLVLNGMRVIAVAAAFSKGQEVFSLAGAKFNVGHIIAYGAQLTYAAAISSGLFWRHHFGLRSVDQRIRSSIDSGTKPLGFCGRISAKIAERYTLSYR